MLHLRTVRALLLALSGAFATACNGPAATPPAASGPPAAAPAVAADSLADSVQTRRRAGGRPVPFVAPTKIGRLLGPTSPSPPNSRTR